MQEGLFRMGDVRPAVFTVRRHFFALAKETLFFFLPEPRITPFQPKHQDKEVTLKDRYISEIRMPCLPAGNFQEIPNPSDWFSGLFQYF